ncbi:uncharacterized protein LOC122363669 [Amphibalanus amphitrite]|nr:uncharacterized protein LOC122363669 [Amphibalanus amphitrite]
MFLLRHRRGASGRPPLPRQSSLAAARPPSLSELPRSPSLPSRLSGDEPRVRRTLSDAEESQRFDEYMRSLKWALAVLLLVCVVAGVYSLSGNQRLRASVARLWPGTG